MRSAKKLAKELTNWYKKEAKMVANTIEAWIYEAIKKNKQFHILWRSDYGLKDDRLFANVCILLENAGYFLEDYTPGESIIINWKL